MSRIKIKLNELDFTDENEWIYRNNYYIEMLPKFLAAFDPFVRELR